MSDGAATAVLCLKYLCRLSCSEDMAYNSTSPILAWIAPHEASPSNTHVWHSLQHCQLCITLYASYSDYLLQRANLLLPILLI